ncbi:4900_t:CDS:2 [Funneliformis mosseae]|uniref:4900_t:CDS:1 n=1 Tax=Funneliformis mosseae TaxID=27381 RepID=A0A9N9BV55_FUNMO|nr:4900_t:CDS:2 [Funneliformis mosseae]
MFVILREYKDNSNFASYCIIDAACNILPGLIYSVSKYTQPP